MNEFAGRSNPSRGSSVIQKPPLLFHEPVYSRGYVQDKYKKQTPKHSSRRSENLERPKEWKPLTARQLNNAKKHPDYERPVEIVWYDAHSDILTTLSLEELQSHVVLKRIGYYIYKDNLYYRIVGEIQEDTGDYRDSLYIPIVNVLKLNWLKYA